VKVSTELRRQNERRGEWEGVDSQIQKSTRWFLEPSQICRVAKEAALRPAASPPPPSPPPSCFFSRAHSTHPSFPVTVKMCIELNVVRNASLESYIHNQNTIGSIQLFALSLSSVISLSVLAHRTSSSRNHHPVTR
jgi:hypothetical protein